MELKEISVGHCAYADTADDPNHTTDGTERHGFDQELREDVVAVSADGHAHTDLARSLSHAHKHDVHVTKTADHQRDAGNCAQQKRHDARGCRGGFSDFLLVAHREIIVASGPDIMPLSK